MQIVMIPLNTWIAKKQAQYNREIMKASTRPPCTYHPTPCTPHPASCTLHLTLFILHPTPYTLHPAPHTLHPSPYTLHSTPCTLNPPSYTPHPALHTLYPTPQPYTLHPARTLKHLFCHESALRRLNAIPCCRLRMSGPTLWTRSCRYHPAQPMSRYKSHVKSLRSPRMVL